MTSAAAKAASSSSECVPTFSPLHLCLRARSEGRECALCTLYVLYRISACAVDCAAACCLAGLLSARALFLAHQSASS